MNKKRNFLNIWFIPFLLVIIMTGCEDRIGITYPPAINPPQVSSTDPANGATGVALNQKIVANFNRAMDASTITASTFTLIAGSTSVSGFVSYSGTTAIFSPASNLAPNTAYTGTLTTGAKDPDGNALANNFVWSFTTGSAVVITPPTVNSTDPANSATGVALNQKIAATFSKTMDASSITASTFTLMQGITSVSGFVSYSGTIAIFVPSVNLAPNVLYTATITTGAKDLTGNALAINYVWSFTTGATAVITPPTIVSIDPSNNATGVALNKKVAATFSKTMDATTITTATFTLMQGSTFVSGSVSYVGMTATYTPSSNFMPNTKYTATITTGAKDLTGNALASNYVWSFTTATVTNYAVTLSSNPTLGGTTTGGGTYNLGSTVTVTATPNNGYTFTNWTENGNVVSTAANYQFTLSGNITLVANFNAVPIVVLGAAATFGGFGGSAGLTNQGIFTVIHGDIGTTAASTLVTGFHDGGGNVFTETTLNIGQVTGVINCAPPAPGTASKFAIAQQALADATVAYNYLAGLPGGPDPGAGELGGLVLAPGVYTAAAGTFKITSNDLTLDAQNNPNAVWVFQMAQSLTVGLAGQPRSIILVNGAQAKNIFWQVGSSATINGAGGGTMIGTIIAYSGVTFSTADNVVLTTLNGRALSLVASVTLVNTIVNVP